MPKILQKYLLRIIFFLLLFVIQLFYPVLLSQKQKNNENKINYDESIKIQLFGKNRIDWLQSAPHVRFYKFCKKYNQSVVFFFSC